MVTFKEAIEKVLKKAKKPLKIKEITFQILTNKIVKTKGITPDATICSLIEKDIKKRGDESRFLKVGPSTYKLNPNLKNEEKIIKRDIKDKREEREETIILLGQKIKVRKTVSG